MTHHHFPPVMMGTVNPHYIITSLYHYIIISLYNYIYIYDTCRYRHKMHYSVGGRFLDESRRICDGAPFLPDRSKSMDEVGSQHQVGE